MAGVHGFQRASACKCGPRQLSVQSHIVRTPLVYEARGRKRDFQEVYKNFKSHDGCHGAFFVRHASRKRRNNANRKTNLDLLLRH